MPIRTTRDLTPSAKVLGLSALQSDSRRPALDGGAATAWNTPAAERCVARDPDPPQPPSPAPEPAHPTRARTHQCLMLSRPVRMPCCRPQMWAARRARVIQRGGRSRQMDPPRAPPASQAAARAPSTRPRAAASAVLLSTVRNSTRARLLTHARMLPLGWNRIRVDEMDRMSRWRRSSNEYHPATLQKLQKTSLPPPIPPRGPRVSKKGWTRHQHLKRLVGSLVGPRVESLREPRPEHSTS